MNAGFGVKRVFVFVMGALLCVGGLKAQSKYPCVLPKAESSVTYAQLAGSMLSDPEGATTVVASPLHYAASHGDIPKIDATLKAMLRQTRRYMVDPRDSDEATPLMWAARSGQPYTVKYLRRLGADPNIQDKKGRIALHWALRTMRGATRHEGAKGRHIDPQVVIEVVKALFKEIEGRKEVDTLIKDNEDYTAREWLEYIYKEQPARKDYGEVLEESAYNALSELLIFRGKKPEFFTGLRPRSVTPPPGLSPSLLSSSPGSTSPTLPTPSGLMGQLSLGHGMSIEGMSPELTASTLGGVLPPRPLTPMGQRTVPVNTISPKAERPLRSPSAVILPPAKRPRANDDDEGEGWSLLTTPTPGSPAVRFPIAPGIQPKRQRATETPSAFQRTNSD